MNLNEIQNVWNSPSNNLRNVEQERLVRQFARQMIRRRRFQSIWLIVTLAWLAVISVLVFGNLAKGNLDSALEWAVFPLLIVPWAFAIHFLRRYLKAFAPVVSGASSVTESFRAALVSNRSEQSNLKWAAALSGILIPIVIVVVQQLQDAGKVSPREVNSMALFFGGALLVSSLGMVIRYFGWLAPQRRTLVGLLGELEDAGPLA